MKEVKTNITPTNRGKIEEAHHLAVSAIPKFMKKVERDFKKEENSLKNRDKFVRVLRLITIVTAFASFILAFQNPQYVTLLIPFPLICFVFLIPAENIWLKNIEEQIEKARKMANPLTAKRAMNFLNKPNALTNLQVLLEDPSEEAGYQQNYISMLVDIGSSCEWIDTKINHLEATVDTMQAILEESYSAEPKTFDPQFLKSWKKTFGELQHELKGYFGGKPVDFCKKTSKNPTYFLDCFRNFIKSDTAKRLKHFLHDV